MPNFAALKAQTRRNVHTAFAVSASYYPPGGFLGSGVVLTARLHGKLVQGGDLSGGGYAIIIENVTRVVFNREELATLEVTPIKRGRIYFPDYEITVSLETKDPYDGPINERWALSPSSQPAAAPT